MSIFGLGDGSYPAVAYNFALQVEGAFFVPCKSVHSFTKENEYEYIQEGGLNDYVHMRRKSVSKPFTFQVERYVGMDLLGLDPMPNGTEFALPILLWVNRYQATNATGILGDSIPVRLYTFTGCRVTEKTFGELDAERSGLLIETTTIAYHQVTTINNPATSLVKTPWDARLNEPQYAKRPKSVGKNKDLIKKWEPKKPEQHFAKWPSSTQKNESLKKKWDASDPKKHIAKTDPETPKIEKLIRKWDVKNDESSHSSNRPADAGAPKNAGLQRKWDAANDAATHSSKRPANLGTPKNAGLQRKWDATNDADTHSSKRPANLGAPKNAGLQRKWDAANDAATHSSKRPVVTGTPNPNKSKWPANKRALMAAMLSGR
ncbi:MAG: hypothetical protein J6O55_07020 [Lachnospiraceae bacterium]|nr:hypothetical protein [Lachnospiraceae bacterium]